jgi:hypothetical protein
VTEFNHQQATHSLSYVSSHPAILQQDACTTLGASKTIWGMLEGPWGAFKIGAPDDRVVLPADTVTAVAGQGSTKDAWRQGHDKRGVDRPGGHTGAAE